MSRLTRYGAAEAVSRDHILSGERGQEIVNFPVQLGHEQGLHSYPVDPYCLLYIYVLKILSWYVLYYN